jgi:hypothetical protein
MLNPPHTLVARAVAAVFGMAAAVASAQGTDSGGSSASGSSSSTPAAPSPSPAPAPSPAPGGPGGVSGPQLGAPGALPGTVPLNSANPWYLGASETLTHDSNVFRVPNGPSGNISSTSVLGGFDQPISRQRISGAGNVSYNNYFGHSELDNTSYNLQGNFDWQTVGKLAGNVGVSFGQNLSQPVTGAGLTQHANQSTTQHEQASVLWGGVANFGIEGFVSHDSIDYSADESKFLNSYQNTASVVLRWLPSGPLKLGLGYRETRLVQPDALQLANGTVQRNDVRGKNIDLFVDYLVGPTLAFNGRISRTEQRNSGATSADFSGNTGYAVLNWQVTGKTSLSAYASRDVGFNTTPFAATTVFLIGNTPFFSNVTGLYQNNQLTTSGGLSANWQATGKITAYAGVRYSRAKLISTLALGSVAEAVPDTTDRSKIAYIGASWSITRGWSLGCNAGYENRDVTGTVNPFSYNDTTIGCTGQYTWR